MAFSTRLKEPPGFDPTASIAATVASGVLPFKPELRPDSITRFVIPTGGGAAIDCGRNHLRKDNAFFTADFGVARPFRFGERYVLTPKMEIFNTFNNKNNVNPLSTPALFDFNGFLRVGVGDPRQAQLSVRFEF